MSLQIEKRLSVPVFIHMLAKIGLVNGASEVESKWMFNMVNLAIKIIHAHEIDDYGLGYIDNDEW